MCLDLLSCILEKCHPSLEAVSKSLVFIFLTKNIDEKLPMGVHKQILFFEVEKFSYQMPK